MPITLTPINHDDLCHGWAWSIGDETLLARRIACVALGQFNHVAKILAGADIAPFPPTTNRVTRAAGLLTVPDGQDASQRDGWLFQVISWIASHKVRPGLVIRSPHMIWAHKGFDGLQLEIDDGSGAITAVIIFEDKATVNPREMIRKSVWPEFRKLEEGDRENVLVSEAALLLAQHHRRYPDLDVDYAVENIFWKQARRYRVSITIGTTHSENDDRRGLFDDFDKVAAGQVERRRAETLFVPELRPWMARLAEKAIAELHEMMAANV